MTSMEIEDGEVIRITHGELEVRIGCSTLSCTGPTILEIDVPNRDQVRQLNVFPNTLNIELAEEVT